MPRTRPEIVPMGPRAAPTPARLAASLVFALALAACDDPKSSKPTPSAQPEASPTPSASPSGSPSANAGSGASAEPAKPKTMPDLLVDSEGPYLAGTRIELHQPGGQEKLDRIIKNLPIEGNP